MFKTKMAILAGAMFLVSSFSYGQNLEKFKSLLNNCWMNISIPDGMVECPVIKNSYMLYDYAVKYPDKDLEVRYAIRPIKQKKYENDSTKTQMEEFRQFRNDAMNASLMSICMNVSETVYRVIELDKKSINEEFNADWGASGMLKVKPDFAKGYSFCMIAAIHKKDVADAYYFFLTNSREKLREYASPLINSLKFDK